MKSVLTRALLSLALLSIPALAESPPSWRAVRGGVEMQTRQLTRPAALAFYQARGFSADAIASYAAACSFAFELHNRSDSTLRLHLVEWEAVGTTGRARFRLPQDWDAEWSRHAVAEPARIAFRWAQFPAEQEFAPGDWIMGMGTLDRRMDSPFRLIVRYRDNNRQHEIVLENVTCAALD